MGRLSICGLSLLLGAPPFINGFSPAHRLCPFALHRHVTGLSSSSSSSGSASSFSIEKARAALKRYDELSIQLDDETLSDARLSAILDELDQLEVQGIWDNEEVSESSAVVESNTETDEKWIRASKAETSNEAKHSVSKEASSKKNTVSPEQAARDAALFEKALR